jgi:hypothetical protein
LVQKYEKNAAANDKCVFATCTEFRSLKLQKNTLPLQQHFYGISHLKLLKNCKTMIFWSLCAFIWFQNIEKMLLQMTSGFLQLESTIDRKFWQHKHTTLLLYILVSILTCHAP